MATLVLNELLCFLSSRSDKLDRDHVLQLIIDTYNLDEIVTAKKLLISECEKVAVSADIEKFKANRKGNQKEKTDRSAKDLVEIWQIVDKEKAGKLQVQFVAGDLNRVPSFNIEKLNLKSLLQTIDSLKQQILTIATNQENLSKDFQQLSSSQEPISSSEVELESSETPKLSQRKRKLSVGAQIFTPSALSQHPVLKKQKQSNLDPSQEQTTPTQSKPPTFATLTSNLGDKEKPWSVASALKKRKITSVTGKADSGVLTGVETYKRDYWDFSVTRLSAESTTADKVKTHLQSQNIEVKDVWLRDSKIKGCITAKVRVALAHKEKVKSPELWPNFIRVHDWVYGPRQTTNHNEAPAKPTAMAPSSGRLVNTGNSSNDTSS